MNTAADENALFARLAGKVREDFGGVLIPILC